jgi:hypothetical protein
MPDKPGSQFQDHPNMGTGRAALPRLPAAWAHGACLCTNASRVRAVASRP